MNLTEEQKSNRRKAVEMIAPLVAIEQQMLADERQAAIDALGIAPEAEAETLPFPIELTNPPGLVGEMVEQIRVSSYRDSPALALGSALAGLAHFSGNHYLVVPW